MEAWALAGNEARVAVVGAGFVGRGLVQRLDGSPGMRTALVVNRTPSAAVRALEDAGHDPHRILVSDDPDELRAAIEDRILAVATSPEVITEIEPIDVVVEATGAIDHGARVVLGSLQAGKHVVSMNAEIDATIGYLIHDIAAHTGSVYTISDGDQPGVLLRHMEFVEGMGFEIVAALNCKRNLDVHQTPDSSHAYAARDETSLLMTTAFGDGTKMNIENAVVANLTGLVPDRRGMHGVRTTLADVVKDVLNVLEHRGVVEYTLGGDFAAGVGVIGRADFPVLVGPYMRYFKMGDGPDHFFFRPYHLVHLEAPVTIAEVVLDRMPLRAPAGPPVADVVAVAKRDLEAGDRLDGIGGFTCYGQIDTVERAEGLLPIGLSEHARLIRRVRRDDPIPLDAVEIDDRPTIVELRRRQDGLTSGAREAAAAAVGP
jgi:predicted homoserine dehydrogenase-like protein